MNSDTSKIGRNDPCPCGSGIKYKNCCMNKNRKPVATNKKLSIHEIFSFLKLGLQNISLIDKEVSDIDVKKIDLLNNRTLECQFYAKSVDSIDVKIETGNVIAALHGFFEDDTDHLFKDMQIDYYAARAFDKTGHELMYVISSKKVAATIGQGNPLEWLKGSIIQENTGDYRLGVAKRQITEIENSLREVIVDRLSKKYGNDWFITAVGRKLRESVIDTYYNQFGVKIEDGEVLIKYTFVLQLKKIICTNWNDFSDLFGSKMQFEKSIMDLNPIRREEAHNRNISDEDLINLKEIYNTILVGITEKYPDILPHFLIDNWKIQIKGIMLSNELNMIYTDDEIQSETNNDLKLVKAVLNLQKLIDYLKDIELKLKSVVVPIQKQNIHNELISVYEKYRTLHEELLECGKTGELKIIQDKQEEIKSHKKTMNDFASKFLLYES